MNLQKEKPRCTELEEHKKTEHKSLESEQVSENQEISAEIRFMVVKIDMETNEDFLALAKEYCKDISRYAKLLE